MPRHEVADLDDEEEPASVGVVIGVETARFGDDGMPALQRDITSL
jgi:hypothetical protein